MIACRLFASLGDGELQLHLINDGDEPIESGVLKYVGFEWGDMPTSAGEPNTPIGRLAKGELVIIWRDPDESPELRMNVSLLVRSKSGEHPMSFEFPRLYMYRELPMIPELGRPGITAKPE